MLLGASRLAASKTVSFDELLVISYLMVAQIALFEWLAGGDTPYGNLYLIPLVFTAGIHPPRRLVPMMLVVAVAACLPLVYDGWNGTEAADIGVQLLLWFAAATAMMVLMTGVRDQRLSLRAGEAEAQRLARVDSLTGLGNRRAFDETLTAEISRARRTGNALSVVIIDVDDFKQINDSVRPSQRRPLPARGRGQARRGGPLERHLLPLGRRRVRPAAARERRSWRGARGRAPA